MITAGGDGTIRHWDRATLQSRGEALPAHNAAVSSVAVSPGGNTIATAGRRMPPLQLWDPTGTPQLPDAIQLDAPASSLSYTPDGTLVGRYHRRPDRSSRCRRNAPSQQQMEMGTV